MTLNQAQAVWELCRQRSPLLADDADNRWAHREPFEMRPRVKLPLHFLQLIERRNWEAEELKQGRLRQRRAGREAEVAAIE
jgi:hypothetical protein